MGGGRKTKTIISHERNTWPGGNTAVGNISAPARNLRKNDLGGVIFGCKHNTISECLAKQIFGLPGPHISYVSKIEPGLPLFLFNYSDRKLHGIYEAASHGQMNINPYGWTENGKDRTPYPAQVHICIKKYCQPLTEAQFREIIGDNYYKAHHFYFELDHTQVKDLYSLFMPTPQAGKIGLQPGPSSGRNLLFTLPATKKLSGSLTERVKNAGGLKKNSKLSFNLVSENKYASLFCNEGDNDPGSTSKTSSSATEEGEPKESVSDWEDLDHDNLSVVPFGGSHEVSGESQTFLEQDHADKDQGTTDEAVLLKLKKLAFQRKFLNQSPMDFIYNSDVPFVSGETNEDIEQIPEVTSVSLKKEDTTMGEDHLANDADSAMLIQVKELKEKIMLLEKKQVESERELQQLRNQAKESSKKDHHLTEHVKELELKLDPSMALVVDSMNEALVDFYLGSEKLVYLIGGFDGTSWLSALDSYSPSLDILTPLRSMSSDRSYASAAALNGCLYVFGGGDGSLWYDTVECYNPRNDEWTLCPSLVREKGSLAGATLNGKIFAIGGGNGMRYFSDVEMFDPALGRWINNQSMLQKRYALAAAELNGALYAVGGFDGWDYLKSAERFDPRETCWTKLPSMNTRRGCHSLTILNGKLYAVGGYDGEKMVSSVEVFDPRLDSWEMGDPMNVIRGYAAAPTLGDSLFVIGGVEDEENIADTVECYKEGIGWTSTGLRAVGKRCFFSAIVL